MKMWYCQSQLCYFSVYEDDEGCLVKGKCYTSQRKNESPYDVKVLINQEQVEYSFCTCAIGQSGYYGHVTALLYEIAFYKLMKYKLIPTDIARTSLPQTWHVPRGEKLQGEKVDNIVVQGYDRNNPQRATKGIKSTLYNPICGEEELDVNGFLDEIKDLNIIFNTSVENSTERVQTKFGNFQKGSVLSYQQKLATDYVLNLMEVNDFPNLPVRNVMKDNVSYVLSENQLKKFDSLKLTELESIEMEESTREQSNDPKWHKLRHARITASSSGEIAKRRADGRKLAERLQTARRFQSAAMKRGIESEGVAAQAYSEKMDNNVNLYPCGVVVSPFSHWLAATPDRKVYCPSRDPPFGLLEIKSLDTDDLSKVKCL
ncbi:uncharacterized protein LOC125661419 [Ostrea edulis]|uniref:uncharacterized protein LOC125661419 n=1 Tax=Ostrea edulis TaxID=37623 RepID=UPI0024AF3CFE|nr:uncharacterized protein LOC125661419 [Ostrea edulis]